MKIKLFLTIVIALILGSSCKSEYEALLQSNDIAGKYDAAFTYFEAGKYSRAIALFESLKLAVKGTAQDDTVQYYTGMANYRWGDIFTAETCFDSFIKTFPLSVFTDRANYYYIECLYQQTLRYELDQTPTYKAMDYIESYLKKHPDTEYKGEFEAMLVDMNERLDKKAFEAAKVYYHTEDYKAAQYAFRNVLKEDASNIYREDVLYHLALSSYKYAFNSVYEKQKERYMTFTDDYYNFISEFPESKYRRELDNLSKRVEKILKKK
ncbi:MAG: outer membrane protein assembly factor BamD [Bacteroidales bacterium]|jgi:outer membrane protein assembly factor BamD|nr:outer membrane protein assembly factor BamD [Bacteroidales bacterium]MBQ2243790.1 outer membrane protein assembly factor BamD [Bacteroidales bacterium]